MQLRHLRYFVSIVDAGSFSRAAAIVHVAQPALSQQISELEDELGVALLLRHARGIAPTAAGDRLYREAVAILKQVEQLPGIVRSTEGDPQGVVKLGMSSTLAATIGGPFIQSCRDRLPKVMIRFHISDSETLKRSIADHALDLALLFEDELVAGYARTPLFRQRLYFITGTAGAQAAGPLSIQRLTELPLVMPTAPNILRSLLERRFAAMHGTPNIVSEGDQLSSILSLVQQGLGGTVLPRGTAFENSVGLAPPLLIEPPLFLTASVLWSGDAALGEAAEAVKSALAAHIQTRMSEHMEPGLEPIGLSPDRAKAAEAKAAEVKNWLGTTQKAG
ncbi:LysR substrate-binding domain-containing protein [Enterovirga rhinocerotis]|uniref:LysR family transcriptional regulator n=1 Tax=Enterovirga rhinocerotis TaxID=1339210 RepID=A0A4R7C4F9_9HYPH|nr:LysR substrate-binding domain-containing protein [Enterovirga rhinocerotis]TDR93041.1 LysR family transcriptional regulator [Enterovirga rhinocerotis]